jgi:formate dehydrogenase subunit delta
MSETLLDPKQKLADMAGQMADYFRSYPHDEAVHSIADHINQFWSRRMRLDFLNYAQAHADTLDPLVREAVPGVNK